MSILHSPILNPAPIFKQWLFLFQGTPGLQLQAAQAALTSANLDVTRINQAMEIAVEQHAAAVVGGARVLPLVLVFTMAKYVVQAKLLECSVDSPV